MEQQFFISDITYHFNLRTPKGTRPTPVYLVVRFQGKQFKFTANCKVLPQHWSARQEQAFVSPDLSTLDNSNNRIVNNKILQIKLGLLRVLKYLSAKPSELVDFIDLLKVELIKQGEKRMRRENAISWLSNDLDKDPMKQSSKRIYQHSIDEFERFCKSIGKTPLQWSDINYKLIMSFQDWLMDSGKLNDRTCGETISRLITRLKKAEKQDKIDIQTAKIHRYTKPTIKCKEEDNTFALSEAEIEALCDLKLRGKEAQVRDLFVFQIWCGQRFSDLMRINEGIIDKEARTITIIQQKKSKKVVIPIFPITQRILERYNWVLPTFCENEYNKTLKELALKANLTREHYVSRQVKGEVISEKRKIYEDIASHCARRTFITLMVFKNLLDREEIMKISGHSTDSAFRRYIKLDGDDVARKALSLLDERVGKGSKQGEYDQLKESVRREIELESENEKLSAVIQSNHSAMCVESLIAKTEADKYEELVEAVKGGFGKEYLDAMSDMDDVATRSHCQ